MEDFTDLTRALAELSDRALIGLRAGTQSIPNAMSGLGAWLEHAVDWESDRRAGRRHYPLQGPRAAIADSELDLSLLSLALLTEGFRGSKEPGCEQVAAFLEISAAILRAEAERPDTLQ